MTDPKERARQLIKNDLAFTRAELWQITSICVTVCAAMLTGFFAAIYPHL